MIAPDQRFHDDDGAAEPRLAAALTGYAAGRCSEQAVLAALAGSRLLVPVVAALTLTQAQPAPGPDGRVLRAEKASEMALPTLAGNDGRRALIAFTSVAALRRWREDARPLPAPVDRVCQAAAAEDLPAVVVDVAGPVPLVLEGARLTALAAGRPPPPPAGDPDVLAAVAEVAAADPGVAAARPLPGSADTDLTVELTLTGPAAEGAARRTAAAIMSTPAMTALAGRFRRGIEITVVFAGAPAAAPPASWPRPR